MGTENCVEVGRSDLVDRKSEARTIAKTRRALKRASGGVLFVDEPYTLFPSLARPRGRDHGSTALKELARGLDSGSPLVIMGGQSNDLQKVLSCNVGFKNNVLIRFELPDLLTAEIVRIFFMKMIAKGYVPADSLTIQYTTQLLENNTWEEWRLDRNGRVADLLVDAVRVELKEVANRSWAKNPSQYSRGNTCYCGRFTECSNEWSVRCYFFSHLTF